MKLAGVQMALDIPPEEWERLLREKGFLDVVEAGFAVPYAEAIEYGTPPGTVTPYDEIVSWAERKLFMKDPKERADFARRVVSTHYKRGRAPKPFFRPAIREAAGNARKTLNAQEGVYAIAEDVISIAIRNIREQGITDRGTLIKSAFVRRADPEDARRAQERFR